MAITYEEPTTRQASGATFLPQHAWDYLGAEKGAEIFWGMDKGRHGKFIALYIKPKKEEPAKAAEPEKKE